MAKPGTFKPGQSGNPSGRPKVIGHVQELARAQTDAAIRTLTEIHGDPSQPAPARVAAAQALLDRAWGKPSQSVDMTSKGERMGYVIPAPPEAASTEEWTEQHKPH